MRTRTLCVLFAAFTSVAYCSASIVELSAAESMGIRGPGESATATVSPKLQKAELPSAKALLQGHVKASGGIEALKALKSSKTTGKLDIPAFGIKGDITIFQAAPNHMKMIVDLGQFGEQSSGFDGKVAWEIGQQGSEVLDGERAEQIKLQGHLMGFAVADSFYDSMETVKETEFDDQEAYAVLCKKKGSSDKTLYFAKDSGFVIGSEGVEPTAAGKLKVVALYQNYKKIDDVHLPTRLTIKVPGMQQEIELSKIELNVDLPDDAFELPASIKQKLR